MDAIKHIALVSCALAPLSACSDRGVAENVHTPKGPGSTSGALLCSIAETELFRCSLKGSTISVCASSGRAAVRTALEHPGDSSLVAEAASRIRSSLTWGIQGYSGGGETQILGSAPNGTVVFYDRLAKTSSPSAPSQISGIAIVQRRHKFVDEKCNPDPAASINPNLVRKFLSKGETVDWSSLR